MTCHMMMKECVMWRLTKRYEAAMEGSELQNAENLALKTEVRVLKMRVNEYRLLGRADVRVQGVPTG